MVVNVAEAKTNLSKLIDLVYHGESVTIAKNNRPLIDLVAHKPKNKREFGLYKGQLVVTDDFNDEKDEINEMFYGK